MTKYQERRYAIIRRDGGRCILCGRRKRLTLHHLRPRHIGGRDTAGNLITVCTRCHATIHDRALWLSAWICWFYSLCLLHRPRRWREEVV